MTQRHLVRLRLIAAQPAQRACDLTAAGRIIRLFAREVATCRPAFGKMTNGAWLIGQMCTHIRRRILRHQQQDGDRDHGISYRAW